MFFQETEKPEAIRENIQEMEKPEATVENTQETEKPESAREDAQRTEESELTEEKRQGIEEPAVTVQTETEEFDEEKAIQEVLGQIKKTVQERNMGTLPEQPVESLDSERVQSQLAEVEQNPAEMISSQALPGSRKKDRKKNRKGRR
ncbi:MAG: hypothetical protein K2K20_07840 [Lachnospiraceae bacterium]|nr:hypothetical protein [Lachnospiraceae bacterium]